MVGILGHDDAGDGCLGRHATFDQARLGGCLYDASFTGSAGIPWTAGYKHTELGRYDIQPFADIFANGVTFRAAAAGAIGCDHFFDARQVLGQSAASLGWLCRV